MGKQKGVLMIKSTIATGIVPEASNLPTRGIMNYKKEMETGTLNVLRTSQTAGIHMATVMGLELVVLEGVFSPKYFADTEFFIRNMPIEPGQHGLEIGPGTGAFSVFAALNGLRMDAIDINPAAVMNTRINAVLQRVERKVNVVQGDVFTTAEKLYYAPHDFVFWNHPFNLTAEPTTQLTDLERSVSDPGYEATQRFITEAATSLRRDIPLYIGTSLKLGQDNLVFDLFHEAGYQTEIIAQDNFDEGGNLIDYTLIRGTF